MASKGSDTNQGGLMSSAGLTTYYDAEEEKINVEPLTILMFGAVFSLVCILCNLLLV